MVVLKKKSVGLDISDRTIEVVELTDEGDKKRVTSMGRIMLETGIVERGRIKDAIKLGEAINRVFAETKPHHITTRKVIFGLPESQVYTHIFELGAHDIKERDELVAKEAQNSIPLKESDVLSSYSVLWEEENKVEILLIVISKTVFLEWRNFFQNSKLVVEQYDVETLATFRGLFLKRPKAPVCVVDIGVETASIAIFSNKGLRYSYTLEVAGGAMTQEIAKDLKISEDEAEERKIKIGLSDKKDRIFFILIKILQQIAESVSASLTYYKERTGEHIDGIILVGGSSKLKGLVNYFKDELGLSVWIGESILLRNITSLEYIEAIGLALRGLDKSWDEIDPVFYVKPPTVKSPTLKGAGEEQKDTEGKGEKKEEIQLATPVELEKIRRLEFEKKMLLVVLGMGIALIASAALYRDYMRGKVLEELQRVRQQEQRVLYIQNFTLTVPVVTETKLYSSERIRGRIFNHTVEKAKNVDEARVQSKTQAEATLSIGEVTWDIPVVLEVVNDNDKEGEVKVKFSWLIYIDTDVNRLFTVQVEKLYKEETKFTVNAINRIKIESTDTESTYNFVAEVSVSSSELLKKLSKGKTLAELIYI